jgi:hypothetical protein
MQYHTPSILSIECPPLVPDNTPLLICPSCGDTMQHVRTIPKLERVWNSSSSSALPANRSRLRKFLGTRHEVASLWRAA